MKKFRLSALLLALLMLTGILAGCNSGGQGNSTTPVPGTSTKAPDGTTEVTTPATVKMNGYEFLWGHSGKFEATGQTANDDEMRQIYAEIEEMFDCKIVFINPGNNTDNMTASAVSGTKIVDFIRARQSSWIPLAMMGGLRALDSEEMLAAGLELSNEDNFHQFYTQMSNLNGHIWALDISGKYDRMAFGHVYAFNKRLVSEAGYEPDTLFQAVRDGKWNYGMFLEIARKISRDNDGDGINDVWGVALDCDGNEIWTNGTGPIVQDDTGKWVANLSDPRLIKSLEFMTGVSGDPQVQTSLSGDGALGRGDRRNLFYEGKAGFAGLLAPTSAKKAPSKWPIRSACYRSPRATMWTTTC